MFSCTSAGGGGGVSGGGGLQGGGEGGFITLTSNKQDASWLKPIRTNNHRWTIYYIYPFCGPWGGGGGLLPDVFTLPVLSVLDSNQSFQTQDGPDNVRVLGGWVAVRGGGKICVIECCTSSIDETGQAVGI